MIVLHDPDTLLHETVELLGAKTIRALESPDRIRAILKGVDDSHHELKSIISPLQDRAKTESLLDLIHINHGSEYIKHLEEAFTHWRTADLIEPDASILPECFVFTNSARSTSRPPKDIYARTGYFAFDMSSGIMAETYTSVLASANLASEAVKLVGSSESSSSSSSSSILALCRPPGHHCDGRRAGGYCYVNNVAVAVSTWRSLCADPDAKVGILDIDFHHGNGTQEIFYHDANVFYTSIHGEDEFPYYTGFADETGLGGAEGTNLNLPLATGSTFEQYVAKLHQAVSSLARFKPDLLLVSLGFDTYRLDPLGSFQIDTADYEQIARVSRHAIKGVPAVIVLEGGYVIEHLGTNVLSFLQGWEEAEHAGDHDGDTIAS